MQIREEEKQTNIRELLRCLNVEKRQLNEMVALGLLPNDISTGRYFPSDLLSHLKKWNNLPLFELRGEGKEYLEELIRSSLIIEHGGIFIISPDIYPSNYEGMSDMIERYGIWQSQGLNNHIHLSDITKNVIHQIFLANNIIENWIDKINDLPLKTNCVVYWNGRSDSTICIYLDNDLDDDFLETYDAKLGIMNKNVRYIAR